MSKKYSNRILLGQVYIGNAHSLNDNEQHSVCDRAVGLISLGGFFYAKKFVSGDSFFGADGVCDGIRHDMLQHCTQHGRNVKCRISQGVSRACDNGSVSLSS